MSSQTYFNEVAQDWDTMRAEFFPAELRTQALQTAGVRAGQRAADIGAGSGFITEVLLQQGLDVTAIDPSPAMLEVMQTKFGSNAADYRLGEAQELPLPTGEMDYAFANMVLHHVENPPQAIQEMARILKTGGKLVITDLDEHTFTFLRDEQHDRWMGFKREEVQAWFEAAGLQQVVVDCAGSDCCADSVNTPEKAEVSIFIASGVKA